MCTTQSVVLYISTLPDGTVIGSVSDVRSVRDTHIVQKVAQMEAQNKVSRYLRSIVVHRYSGLSFAFPTINQLLSKYNMLGLRGGGAI